MVVLMLWSQQRCSFLNVFLQGKDVNVEMFTQLSPLKINESGLSVLISEHYCTCIKIQGLYTPAHRAFRFGILSIKASEF